MAHVVALSSITTDEVQAIIVHNMLRMIFNKLLRTIPERRHCLLILVHADHKAILPPLIAQNLERVIRDIAVILDIGFHAPIVIIIQHQRVSEEEPRLIAAHVSIALGASIDDFALLHVLSRRGSFLLINPAWKVPVFLRDTTVVCFPGYSCRCRLLKPIVKLPVVQEHPVIMVVPVEAVLDILDGLDDTLQIRIPYKSDKRCIGSSWWIEWRYHGMRCRIVHKGRFGTSVDVGHRVRVAGGRQRRGYKMEYDEPLSSFY